jgi:hypothetical protein
MSLQFSQVRPHAPTAINRTNVRTPKRDAADLFGRVAREIWPTKTAAALASYGGVTQRAAEYWLAGRSPPNAAIAAAFMAEIFRPRVH